jgi:hypothetical protein
MQRRVSHATPRIAIGAGLAGLVGITGLAMISDGMPAGLIILGASAATVGMGVARIRPAASSQCARYQRRHQRLAGPRPGAKLG